MNSSATFFDMPLSEEIKKTLIDIGFTSPTPIQEKSIPMLLGGFDLLGQAQTGTGKTAAFSIPLIELVDTNRHEVQALVVCPTRELCLQVCQEIQRLSVHKRNLATIALYGGQSIEQQFRALKQETPQIVVATPGRLFDHLRRKSVSLSSVNMIVLDEADEMLDMGFRPEIEQIFALLPEENQRIFFSATMDKAIKDLAVSYLRDAKIVKTESTTLTVSTISQSYFRVRGKEKVDLLCRLLDYKEPKLAVVFCNAKSIADEVVDQIKAHGIEAGVLHGDLSQNQRDRVMAQFKAGLIKVLVATDVAARGLDIEDVELVCNFHLPHDPEDYVHRIGRTGRAGRSGCAISLVEPRDNSRLRRICQFAKITIEEEQPPTLAKVKAAKLAKLFAQIKDAIASKKADEYKTLIAKQNISSEDVAAGMLQLAFKKFDDQGNTDELFELLRSKKYSGFEAEKRFKNTSGRGQRGERSSYGRSNDRPGRDRFDSRNDNRSRPSSFGDSRRDQDSRPSFRSARGKSEDQFPRRDREAHDSFRKPKTNFRNDRPEQSTEHAARRPAKDTRGRHDKIDRNPARRPQKFGGPKKSKRTGN